jgi:hypothetical protein
VKNTTRSIASGRQDGYRRFGPIEVAHRLPQRTPANHHPGNWFDFCRRVLLRPINLRSVGDFTEYPGSFRELVSDRAGFRIRGTRTAWQSKPNRINQSGTKGSKTMRLFAACAISFALLSFSGCDQSHDAPPALAPDNRPGVEVHAPNVDVKTNGSGATVRVPGADVHVEKQPPEDRRPDENR